VLTVCPWLNAAIENQLNTGMQSAVVKDAALIIGVVQLGAIGADTPSGPQKNLGGD
jgi:hypothetical protein